MKQRTLTGLGIVAFLLLVFFTKSFTNYIFDGFIVLLAMWAGYEISNILKKIKFYNNKWIIILYPLLSYALLKVCIAKELKMYLIVVLQIALIVALSGLVAILCLLKRKNSDNEIKTRGLKCTIDQFSLFKAIQTMFGLIYPCFIIMLLIVVNNVESMEYIFANMKGYGYAISIFLLVYTFIVPIFVDTFAMLTGSLFKGKKLCPKISPNKTISGAIGGLVWGVICSICVYFVFNSIDSYRVIFEILELAWWKVLVAGIASSILCQIGDIFESLLKRKANVKDSGNILPGHGGILDRFDSHIANILVVFILLILI